MFELNLNYESERARHNVQPIYEAIHHEAGQQELRKAIKAVPPSEIDLHWRGMTLICKALQHRNVDAVMTLMDQGADITRLSQVSAYSTTSLSKCVCTL